MAPVTTLDEDVVVAVARMCVARGCDRAMAGALEGETSRGALRRFLVEVAPDGALCGPTALLRFATLLPC